MRRRVLIMGAAGRDFHNFNVYFRDKEEFEVVCFTATQIPNIEGRVYPPELAGRLYPEGIPIYPESQLSELIKKYRIQKVIFAYSDVSHEYVMHRASEALAAGASFSILGPEETMLESSLPVVAVTAVRTGCGKSQTSRKIVRILASHGKRVAVIRHPMPYGDLVAQRVQRFASLEDMDKAHCTIEEREEYEPHIRNGAVVWAGVDYEAILREAEKEAEVILWDGGNNDLPFYKPDLHIVVADPHRPGHEAKYHPGEANFRRADVIVINKEETADRAGVEQLWESARALNPDAIIIDAASPIFVEDPSSIAGKKVLVIEDGPTVTHGEMGYGAGFMAAKKYGAAEIIDPRPYAVGSIVETFSKYSHLKEVLPAMGYGEAQMKELAQTINRSPADVVIVATPIDLGRILKIEKKAVRVLYELQEIGEPTLEDVLKRKGII